MKFESKKGFSLVELMVAIGILSFGMAGVGTMLFQSFQADRYNAKQKRAHMAATQIAERFRAGNPLTKNPDDSGTLQGLPPTSSDYGNAVIVGTDLWWQDSPRKMDGTFFCRWTTFDESGNVVSGPPTTLVPAGAVTHILLGWGAGNCTRDSVDTCPRTVRIVVMRDGTKVGF